MRHSNFEMDLGSSRELMVVFSVKSTSPDEDNHVIRLVSTRCRSSSYLPTAVLLSTLR